MSISCKASYSLKDEIPDIRLKVRKFYRSVKLYICLLFVINSYSNSHNYEAKYFTIIFTQLVFFRPENTHKGSKCGYQTDYNLLYWSDEGISLSCKFSRFKPCFYYLLQFIFYSLFRSHSCHQYVNGKMFCIV